MGSPEIDALCQRVRQDLAMIAHPNLPWLEPRLAPDGSKALDVLIVGGGQGGVVTGFALRRRRVDNLMVVDRAPYGREGPWVTYARMPTLRSPKEYTGPDLDLPSLTYQAWHEAKYGAEHWRSLALITGRDWNDYLLFVRAATEVPVRNEVELIDLAPADGLIRATLATRTGRETVYARKVVLATGQDGTGRWWMPDFVAALPAGLRAHTADEIDFERLRGKVVAVLGAGASALDNAATALEAGAAEVHLFSRRPKLQVIQPYRQITFRGFLRHLSDLDDAWRWRFMHHVLGLREGFPQATWDRCAVHPNFFVHTGAGWSDARAAGGRAVIRLPEGEFAADFVIACTGIAMDYAAKPELAHFAGNIRTWADAYAPPADERDDRLAEFPYLAADYSFTEKRPGATPWIKDIHLFAIAATMSFGPSGSSINAMTTAVPKLVDGVTRGLFTGDVERHWAALEAYDVPQAIVPDGIG